MGHRSRVPLAIAALAAALLLGYGAASVGLASGYVDPIARIGAQDEALYAHSALRMARGSGWLTPVFLGRFDLRKPPGLLWAGAASARLFGGSPFALRLPVLLSAVACCLVLFAWTRSSRGALAASAALLLAASNPLFHGAARRFTAEGLLAACVLAALSLLWRDPRLASNRTLAAFGLLTGAAILIKSFGGLLPWLVLAAYFATARADLRPRARRAAAALAIALALAAPWHIYHLAAHRQWFFAEYIDWQIVRLGVTSPALFSADSKLVFYLERLVRVDPALCLLFATALPSLVIAWRRRPDAEPRLLAAALAVFALALAAFGSRIAYYLVTPAALMALTSALYSPLLRGRFGALVLAALACLFALKTQFPNAPWGLDFRPGSAVPSAPVLDRYAQLHRSNELVLVSPDDEFYSATLDLPRVRYLLIASRFDRIPEYTTRLGLVMDANEFLDLPHAAARYAPRLRAWGLETAAPLASVILAHSNDELRAVILASPHRDFLLPRELEPAAPPTHGLVRNGPYLLLLSKTSSPRAGPAGTDPLREIPARWGFSPNQKPDPRL